MGYSVKVGIDRDNKKLYLVTTDSYYGTGNTWGNRFDKDAVYLSEPIFCDDEDRTKKGIWKLIFLKLNIKVLKNCTVRVFTKEHQSAEFLPTTADFEKTFSPKEGENIIPIAVTQGTLNDMPLVSESIQIAISLPHEVINPSLYTLYSSSTDKIAHYYLTRDAIADVWVEYDIAGDRYTPEPFQ